ncbi:MAG: hypothetical protein KGJ80_04630 [Chloroflexota bacterium]|nr:hypothetical protein [Chloroflexota bacterium]
MIGGRLTSPESATSMRIERIQLIYLSILFLLLVGVFALNWISGGTITSPRNLAIDLASPPDSPQAWGVQYWIPTKYRALFRWIVQGTFAAFFSPTDAVGFYGVFVSWSFVFFYGAVVAFYYYLQVLGFSKKTAFIGGVLFLASPPVMLAYKYPVYTREDPLAYLLVTLGLIAVYKSKPVILSLIATAAAWVRETTLILPLVYLLASKDSWRKRLAVCALPVAAVVGIRIMLRYAPYDPFEGSIYNFDVPLQSAAFIFCVFGVLWLPALFNLWQHRRDKRFPSEAWRFLVTTAPMAIILVVGTHIALARAREIRISFLLFPWIIPLALDWFRAHSDRLKAWARKPSYWFFSLSVFAVLSSIILIGHVTNSELMRDYLADFKNGYWLAIADVHLSATLAILLPVLFESRTRLVRLAR